MPPRPRVTAAEVVDWAARHTAGETIRAIAASTGRAPAAISHWLPGPPKRGRHITDRERAEILAHHAAGLNPNRIAQVTGHTWETVRRVLARAADQASGEAPDARTSNEPGLTSPRVSTTVPSLTRPDGAR